MSALWDFNQDTQTILRPTKQAVRNGTSNHITSNKTEQDIDTDTKEPDKKATSTVATPTSTQLGIEETILGQPDGERRSFVGDDDSPVKRARDSVLNRQERPLV